MDKLMSQDFALLKLADGRLLLGEGPFLSVAVRPQDTTVFYVNDYALSDPKPWKIPAQVHLVSAQSSAEVRAVESLKIDWDELTPDGFAKVFSEVSASILEGEIEKSVPVATQSGVIAQGDIRSLFSTLTSANENFYPYAWVAGESGFCGLSPELLFNLRKGRLTTMALAGTARADDASVFVFDEKEICEHGYVVENLIEKLSELGMVTKKERSVLNLGSLVHFHTPLEVFLYGDYNVEMITQKLHPTPALGPFPRTQESMQKLIDWRESLGCPSYFGAPFGVQHEGVYHSVVTIRGVHWDGVNVAVPSGCGVIEASRLVNEWRELGLKRNAVKQAFGI